MNAAPRFWRDRIRLHPVHVRAVEVGECREFPSPESVVGARGLDPPRHRRPPTPAGVRHRHAPHPPAAAPSSSRRASPACRSRGCANRRRSGSRWSTATLRWPDALANRAVSSRTYQACRATNQTSANRSRPSRHARIPVGSRTWDHDERRDGPHPPALVQVQEIAEPLDELFIEGVGGRHEVGPEEEAPRDRHPEIAELVELLRDDRRVVLHPHPRATHARPEVDAEPAGRAVPRR